MVKNTGNNRKGNTPLRDNWQTPKELFNILDKQYKFTFDCCSNGKDKKCDSWTSNFEMYTEGIEEYYTHWMNPPFSIAWKMFEQFFKVVKKGVAIYRCDNMESGLWQKIIFLNCDWVFIPKGRISYEGIDGKGARFPSALIGIGVDIPKGMEGTTLLIHPLTQQLKGGNGISPKPKGTGILPKDINKVYCLCEDCQYLDKLNGVCSLNDITISKEHDCIYFEKC